MDNSLCSSAAIMVFLKIVQNFLNIVRIIGPILAILSLSITMVKLVTTSDDSNEKKLKSNIKNSLFALVFLFFIPTFLNVIFNMLSTSTDSSVFACWDKNTSNTINLSSDYQEIDNTNKQKIISDSSSYDGYTEKPQSENNSSSDDNSNSVDSTTDNNSSKHRIGSALSVLHAYNSGDFSKVEEAISNNYWAVECDSHDDGYCYHDYKGSNAKTLQYTLEYAKKTNTKVIVDLKGIGKNNLSSIINSANARTTAIIQIGTSNPSGYMSELNSKSTSGNYRYWALLMNDKSLSKVTSNASEYMSYGMTGVNIEYRYATKSNLQKLKNAGYSDICVFRYAGKFSDDKVAEYTSNGATHLMTGVPNQ